jgi:GntR family transcriptional regulator/MocR family aminotransferase
LLVELDRTKAAPLRAQLECELRRAIQSGRLEEGALLPSTRALADDLGVSRGVVVDAYAQLTAEGYLVAEHGSATRVAPCSSCSEDTEPVRPSRAPSVRYDFGPGLPDTALFPQRDWLAAVRRVVTTSPVSIYEYGDLRGAEAARATLASYLTRARGTAARADRIVMCTGSTQGVDLLARVLKERGVRRVAVEDPGHTETFEGIRAAGVEPLRVPVDADGLDVARLARTRVTAVLVTPAHQYPSGVVMSQERRTALLAWAEKTNGLVIEDDYDAEYRYDRHPIGALQGLAPERVVYMGTASKTLSPALRLGWLVAPADVAKELVRAKRYADFGSPTIDQLALADFIERGDFDCHLRKTRRIYRRRRDALAAAIETHLPKLRVQGMAAGLHLMLDLGPRADERAVVGEALARGIRVMPGSRYRAKPGDGPPALVLGYGGIDEERVPEGVRRLALVLRELGADR